MHYMRSMNLKMSSSTTVNSKDDFAKPNAEELAIAHKQLDALWSRGRQFLGTQYAIMAGAMSWVSERHLVSAVSNAGGFGIIACGAMTPQLLEQEIIETAKLTKKPFAVNLITMHPQIDALIGVCLRHNMTHVVLAGGLPNRKMINALKEGGAKVIAFAPALILAKKLVKMGVDALIVEGMEAGGHVGGVSLTVLAQEILPFIHSVPVFVAGGLGRGTALVSYLEQGASGGQFGTCFAASQESIAHDNFKNAFVRASCRDAVASVQIDERFPVIPVRALRNAASKKFIEHQAHIIEEFRKGNIERSQAQLSIEKFWSGALRKAVIDGDVEHGSVMAGQSVGMVKSIEPVKTIIQRLVEQAITALVYQKRRIDDYK